MDINRLNVPDLVAPITNVSAWKENRIIPNSDSKNTNVQTVNVKPDDYDTGNWIKVVNKRKVKRKKRLARRNNEANDEYIRRLKEKKINERKNAELWYDVNSWQHKILSDQLCFKDGGSISDKYNCSELIELYKNANNNYRKNGIYSKLFRVITKEEWEIIKDQVIEK